MIAMPEPESLPGNLSRKLAAIMKWHVQWPAFVLALVGVVFLAADRLTGAPTVVVSQSGGRTQLSIPVLRDGHYYLKGSEG